MGVIADIQYFQLFATFSTRSSLTYVSDILTLVIDCFLYATATSQILCDLFICFTTQVE